MLFSTVKVLLHHGHIALDGIISRTNRLVKQVRIPHGIQNSFYFIHVASFHWLLNQTQRADKEMTGQSNDSYKIQNESRPETAGNINANRRHQCQQTQPKTILNNGS